MLPILVYEVWKLRSLFARIRPSIVHINNGGYPAALSARAAAVAAKLAGVPRVIMVVNNLAVDYSRLTRWFDYPLDRLVARCVTKFVTGSVAAARQLKGVLKLNDGRCMAIHNGITLRQVTETPETTRARLGLERFNGVVFGMVAVMEIRKGHRVLLEALNKLVDKMRSAPHPILILLEGDGPLSSDLKDYVTLHGLSKYCVFVGEERNVFDFMAFVDVLILPSIEYEDFPNVILEAMGLGKPVIATRLAGIPEQVVDGETGLLVDPKDVGQLAAAIAKLASDDDLRLRMGQAGRRRFDERFTSRVAVGNYCALYESLTNAAH